MYHFFAEHENIFDDYIDIKGGEECTAFKKG